MDDYKAIFISDYVVNNCIVQEAIFALNSIGVEIVNGRERDAQGSVC
jgi:hypothetical protein